MTHPEPDPRDPGRWCVLVVGRRTREAGVWRQRNVPSTANNTLPVSLDASLLLFSSREFKILPVEN
ncbi:MAG: hypothetical protein AAFX01_11660 [Cyanobacteria bacterium J06638_28]